MPSRRPCQRGFTLLELLVVIIIVGVMVTFATLSIGDRALSDQLRLEARRLHAALRFAAEESEIKGTLFGFRHTSEYYEFLGIDTDGKWQARMDGPFRRHALPHPLRIELRVEGRPVPPAQEPKDKEEGPQPQVLILPSGEVSPFSLAISATGLGEFYRIGSDALGRFDFEREEGRGQ